MHAKDTHAHAMPDKLDIILVTRGATSASAVDKGHVSACHVSQQLQPDFGDLTKAAQPQGPVYCNATLQKPCRL
jgi:hypothetical protein